MSEFKPPQLNADRMIQLLSEKIARTEVENAALKTQVEQYVKMINELINNKNTEEVGK